MVRQERVELRLEGTTLEHIDQWRSEQPEFPNRSEAIRRLISEGLNSNQQRALFAITKLQVYSIATSDKEKKVVSNAYLYAWKHGIFPHLQTHTNVHAPFDDCFAVSKQMIEELVGYLNKCWMKKEVTNFYDLEDRYGVYIGDGDWDRSLLIDAIRYIRLSNTFTEEFWVEFMRGHNHPSEASSMVDDCDDDERLAMLAIG
jgi:metal-responsive CopG/Arc/MetJ family transcriptional regulator